MFGIGLGRRTGLDKLVTHAQRLAARYRAELQRSLPFRIKRKFPQVFFPQTNMWREPDQAARKTFDKIMARAAPSKGYVLYFTPRSGSSRVTDILTQTDRMGAPGECFNPVHVPVMAKVLGARDLDEFINVVARHKMRGGVQGFDITYGMIIRVFYSEDLFLSYFGEKPCFWLIREDIVMQAVSLYKMSVTHHAHSVGSDDEKRKAAEARFVYDAGRIEYWIQHIRDLEHGCERMFARHGVSPLRLSYEELSPLQPQAIAELFAQHIGVDLPSGHQLEARHSKIGTSKNDEFAQRFRDERPGLIRKLDRKRARMLSKIHRISA